MDLSVSEFVEGLLSEEAYMQSLDDGKVDDLKKKMQLPKWFDVEKYNQGRRFFWDFCLAFGINIAMSLTAMLAVPSILKKIMGTNRSNSPYTSYKRYASTIKHIVHWHQCELLPGTEVWRSLLTARTLHRRAGIAAQIKGGKTMSQRDMALAQSALICFVLLKPHNFSIRQIKAGDWESYNHFWRTIGYMLGLEDRFNVCRKNVDETRQICQILLERVFTPCLENVPEYYEYTMRMTLGSVALIYNDFIEPTSTMYLTKCYAEVPGYLCSETDRMNFQSKLKEHLKGKSEDIGVDPADLISKSAIDGLPTIPPRSFRVRDFDTIQTTPAYKQLNFIGRYRLHLVDLLLMTYNTDIGRAFLNLLFKWSLFVCFNFPYKVFIKYAVTNYFVNICGKRSRDDTMPKRNSEYDKPPPPSTWYRNVFTLLW